ncbi:signal transduction histidine kinase [Anaerotaenia torta]|uniref:sensor histidine kinase n=1 Tax=Anaerotaenia torta TaxID=433293 RepID=UPI003D1AA320
MNKLSIKLRVTLWYSLLMLLLAGLVLGFMVFVSEYIAERGTKNALIGAVEDNMEELEYEDGEIEIDDDFAFYKSGVSSIIYSAEKQRIDGHIPSGFQSEEPLQDKTLHTVQSQGRQFFCYDRRVVLEGGGELWIRGVIAADENAGIIGSIMRAAFILLPFIVLIAALAGYQITRSSFRPIDRIIRAAGEISEGSDLSKRIALGEGRDEIHRLADTFDHMFRRLEVSFEEEKQFTSDVSHELRTPVSVILTQCEYALERSLTEEEYREALETVQRQTVRMSQIISVLLAFTRLEQGVDKAVFEDTDLSELTGMICEEQTGSGKKGIRLFAEIEPGIHAMVDRTLITRLLSNLLSNSYQYGREGGNIRVTLEREGSHILLSVADDGIGIDTADLDRIWSRFYQANPARTADESGSMGLGLAMVRQIARLHRGEVGVESTLGKGSIFTFRLPVK